MTPLRRWPAAVDDGVPCAPNAARLVDGPVIGYECPMSDTSGRLFFHEVDNEFSKVPARCPSRSQREKNPAQGPPSQRPLPLLSAQPPLGCRAKPWCSQLCPVFNAIGMASFSEEGV